ncbi:porin [Aliivibrio wodanis]|uniref:porin n=1 Tax=Aliivibrio wodanis TaxID=80852 RepID=UPI00406CA3D5
MKKTLVALSVLAASTGSVQAFEVYNQDGVTVGLHGDIEVVYKNETDRSSYQQEIQDADFGFDVRYAINEDVSFGGYWEFDGASGGPNGVTAGQSKYANVGDTYVALYTQSYGSVKVGRTCTALDDAGIGSDYQYGINSFFSNDETYCADEVVRYDFDSESFYATAAFAQDKNNSNSIDNDGSHADFKLGYRVADFDFTAFLGKADLDAAKSEMLTALEARFAGIENVGLAVAYYGLDQEDGSVDMKTTTIALAADYTMNDWLFAAGYSFSDTDEAGKDDAQNWYLNAGYALAPSTTTYAEVGGNNADDSDIALAIGVKASF